MPRFTFLLKAGKHVGPDYSKDPVEVKSRDPDGNEFSYWKYPSKTYTRGAKVQDDANLVAKLGHEKFQLLSDTGTPENKVKGGKLLVKGGPNKTQISENREQRAAPNGQVSDGHQQTTGLDEGGQLAGPAEDAVIRALKAENEELKKQLKSKQQADDNQPTGKSIREEFGEETEDDPDQGSEAEDEDNARLDGMKVDELRELAEEEEIELHGARSKANLIKTIKKSRRAKQTETAAEEE
jgi:hypothetical protein